MPKTNTTTVTQDDDGYYRVRVPKAIGDAMGWAGQEVEWDINSGSSVILREAENDD